MIKSFLINVSHPWGNLGSDYLQTKANMNKVPFLLHSFIHSFVRLFVHLLGMYCHGVCVWWSEGNLLELVFSL